MIECQIYKNKYFVANLLIKQTSFFDFRAHFRCLIFRRSTIDYRDLARFSRKMQFFSAFLNLWPSCIEK